MLKPDGLRNSSRAPSRAHRGRRSGPRSRPRGSAATRRTAHAILVALASAFSLFLGFKVLKSLVAGFALYYLACCVCLPLVDLLGLRALGWKGIAPAIGLERPTRPAVLVGLGSALAMDSVMIAVLGLFRGRVFADGRVQSTLRTWGAGGGRLILVFIVMLAFNGVLEELFWRGYLRERFSGMKSRLAALALPTLFFGLQHVFVMSSLVADPLLLALFVFGITAAGAVWALMRERFGLVSCVLSHALVTAGYLGAFYLLGLEG
jgi:membrane protease YdiL (CAAX protease family)